TSASARKNKPTRSRIAIPRRRCACNSASVPSNSSRVSRISSSPPSSPRTRPIRPIASPCDGAFIAFGARACGAPSTPTDQQAQQKADAGADAHRRPGVIVNVFVGLARGPARLLDDGMLDVGQLGLGDVDAAFEAL